MVFEIDARAADRQPMKLVSLLRHAKSSWDDPALEDIERPLNVRGRKAAAIIAAFMTDAELFPDVVLCSSSLRTRQTLDLILPSLARPPDVTFTGDLYHAGPSALLAQIRGLPESGEHVLVVGHNPGLHMLALDLADARRSSSGAIGRLRKKFPTGALAAFAFDIAGWKNAGAGKGRLVSFTAPKGLQQR